MTQEELKVLCSQLEGKNLRKKYIDHEGILRGTDEELNIRFFWIGKASARYYYNVRSAAMTFQGCLKVKEIQELLTDGQTVDKWNNQTTIF